MLKTLSKLNTCVYYWNSVENTPNNYGKRFPPLLRVFPVTPTVVNNSVGNGFYDAFPGNSSTQNELKIKKKVLTAIVNRSYLAMKEWKYQGLAYHEWLGQRKLGLTWYWVLT